MKKLLLLSLCYKILFSSSEVFLGPAFCSLSTDSSKANPMSTMNYEMGESWRRVSTKSLWEDVLVCNRNFSLSQFRRKAGRIAFEKQYWGSFLSCCPFHFPKEERLRTQLQDLNWSTNLVLSRERGSSVDDLCTFSNMQFFVNWPVISCLKWTRLWKRVATNTSDKILAYKKMVV